MNNRPYLEVEYHTRVDGFAVSDKYDVITDSPYCETKDLLLKENIDRIKLPCYCTFEWKGKRRLGMIIQDNDRELGNINNGSLMNIRHKNYKLTEVDKQTHQLVGGTICSTSLSLEILINHYKINIGKAKLIYYETTGGDNH